MVFIDCVHIKIHRKRSVDTEAFYVVLAVKEDKTREVLGIFNKPTESALGWGEMLNELRERGVCRIGLICADGLIIWRSQVQALAGTLLKSSSYEFCSCFFYALA